MSLFLLQGNKDGGGDDDEARRAVPAVVALLSFRQRQFCRSFIVIALLVFFVRVRPRPPALADNNQLKAAAGEMAVVVVAGGDASLLKQRSTLRAIYTLNPPQNIPA